MSAAGDSDSLETRVLVALARIEGKLDADRAATRATQAEHGRRLDDIEPRLRAVETRPSVSPKALLAGLASVAGVVAALTPFLDRLYS